MKKNAYYIPDEKLMLRLRIYNISTSFAGKHEINKMHFKIRYNAAAQQSDRRCCNSSISDSSADHLTTIQISQSWDVTLMPTCHLPYSSAQPSLPLDQSQLPGHSNPPMNLGRVFTVNQSSISSSPSPRSLADHHICGIYNSAGELICISHDTDYHNSYR